MNSTERPAFEDHLAQLLAGYDRKSTPERIEAYWRGLNRMPLVAFERVVDHALSDKGPDHIPSPKQCWQIYRDMRATPTSAPLAARDPKFTKADIWANRWLFGYLSMKGAASRASLPKLIAAKNKIAASCSDIPDEELDPRELRELLFPAFDKVWQAAPQNEIDDDIARFQRAKGYLQHTTSQRDAA